MIYCVEDERNIRELLIYTLETAQEKLERLKQLMKQRKESL